MLTRTNIAGVFWACYALALLALILACFPAGAGHA